MKKKDLIIKVCKFFLKYVCPIVLAYFEGSQQVISSPVVDMLNL